MGSARSLSRCLFPAAPPDNHIYPNVLWFIVPVMTRQALSR